MPKKRKKTAKIYVSYAFTKFQKFHFERPSKCCGGTLAQSSDLFDIIEEYVFLFGVYDCYVYDLRHPHIKFGILWKDGLPSIGNLPVFDFPCTPDSETKKESD
jgi:hypothetical protein